jgi:hypothetical protein
LVFETLFRCREETKFPRHRHSQTEFGNEGTAKVAASAQVTRAFGRSGADFARLTAAFKALTGTLCR